MQLPRAASDRSPRRYRWSFWFGAASALGAFAATQDASASGYMNPRLADPHGHPALANPYGIYFNPAALGGLTGTNVVVDGTLAWRTADFDRAPTALSPQAPGALDDPNYVAANTGKAHAGNIAGIPFIGASSDFGQRYFFAGVGAYVPFGGISKYDQRPELAGNNAAPGGVDGPQRWALISGSQQSIFTTAAVGFRLPEQRFSFALSGSAVFTQILQFQGRNLAGNDDTGSEGRALVDVSGTHGSFSAGVYWEPLEDHKLRLGASYSARPGLGELRLSGSLSQHSPTYDSTKDIDLLLSYPDVIRAGVATMPFGPKVELRLDAEYVLWSAFDKQCIVNPGQPCNLGPDGSEVGSPPQVLIALKRSWKNAAGVRAGLGYFLDDKTELYGSIGIDTSAVPKSELEPTYPDAFKILGSIGARYQVAQGVTLGASYTFVGYTQVETGRQNTFALAGVSRAPNEDGTYNSKIMFFNLNASFAF